MTSTAKTSVTLTTSFLVDQQQADAADVSLPFTDALSHLRNGRLSVTENDLYLKHLDNAIGVSSELTKSVGSAGADEVLNLAVGTTLSNKILITPTIASFVNAQHNHQNAAGGGKLTVSAINSGAAPSGYVMAADGAGNASWSAPGGGGAQPVDMTQFAAGETLAERDAVYLDSSYQWKKIDTNASPVACGAIRGIVNQSGGIASAATGSVRILGEVSGFTGLTAGALVYASTTAGGYTQTRPTVSAGGGQVALVTLGIAVSTTIVLVLNTYKVEYLKRESLANAASLTILHHADPQGRSRRVRGYVAGTGVGASLATYASSNQDSHQRLRGPSGAGGTTTIAASGSSVTLGDTGGTDWWIAQTLQVTAGIFSQFKVTFSANNGTPSGTVTWQICTDGGSAPGTVLATGTFTPTASAENTVNVTDGPFLAGSTTYWLVLKPTTPQSTNTAWNLTTSGSSVYASGVEYYSTNDGGSWSAAPGDVACAATTSAITMRDKLAQSFQVTGTQTIDQVKLWLKKVAAPAGTMTLRIETNNAGSPSGTLVDANATVTVAESGLTTSYGWITFDFATNFSISGSTTYWLVLSTSRSASNTDYVDWGSDTSSPGYASGEMRGEASSTWSALTADAVFEVFAQGTTFDEPCVIGRSSGGTRDLGVRFDDGSGSNGDTHTYFTNVSSGTLDVTCLVEV